LRVIERAQALGNVSAVCREMGISRTVFYRWRKRLEPTGSMASTRAGNGASPAARSRRHKVQPINVRLLNVMRCSVRWAIG